MGEDMSDGGWWMKRDGARRFEGVLVLEVHGGGGSSSSEQQQQQQKDFLALGGLEDRGGAFPSESVPIFGSN